MEPLASAVDRIKGFADSGKQFIQSSLQRIHNPRKNPIEILKRLQREAFSDIMKLRERQEKVETLLLSYTTNPTNNPTKPSTNIKAIVNFSSSLSLPQSNNNNNATTLDGEPITTGTDSRFVFKTRVREKDYLVAELVSAKNNDFHGSEVTGSPLLLSKAKYSANLDDFWSFISVPFGAKCEDFGIDSALPEVQSLPTHSSFRPPLLNKHHNFGFGLNFKNPNFQFSLSELLSTIRKPSNSTIKQNLLTTFSQISLQLTDQSKLAMSALWQVPQNNNTFSQPIRSRNPNPNSQSPPNQDPNQKGCISLILDLDQDTRFGGWVEIQKSKPNLGNWAVCLKDTPVGELGWVVSVGGKNEGKNKKVQFEGFLSFDLGGNAKLEPGIMVLMDTSGNCFPGFVFRSSWCM
ncbi:hypothetical protein LUZ60_007104 [Juncus effusus]|nr:hypothetical protein LUZ60_007104 [Juncus effusus]